jgi:hypothetical protein
VGLLAAPIAWTVHTVAGFYVTVAACEVPRGVSIVAWEIGLTIACAAVAVVGQAAAYTAWRSTRRADAPPASRIHFFADAALLSNTLFFVLILLGGVTAAHFGGCRQA